MSSIPQAYLTLSVLLTRIRVDLRRAVWLVSRIRADLSTVTAWSSVDPNQTALLCRGPIPLYTEQYVTERLSTCTRDHQCDIRAVVASIRLEKILNFFAGGC